MMGRIHLDMFLQDKFLINGVDVMIRLVRSKAAFALMAGGHNPDYRIAIVNAALLAKKATLNSMQMAHIKALEKSTVKYPMRSVDCKVYSIPAGARSHTHENLFLGTLPKRLVLCINNDAYNGAYDKNPFHAKNNAISFHAVYVDGRQIPSKPFQSNFEDDLFVRSNMSLFTLTGKIWLHLLRFLPDTRPVRWPLLPTGTKGQLAHRTSFPHRAADHSERHRLRRILVRAGNRQ